MKALRQLALLVLSGVLGLSLAQPPAVAPVARFQAVDVYVNSGTQSLAAYQLEFAVKNGMARVVGVEGGGHPAFKDAPFYDPKAIQQERIIVAAFNTAAADKLPTGMTRVVTIHLEITGEPNPGYTLKLETAATVSGRRIPAHCTLEERTPQ